MATLNYLPDWSAKKKKKPRVNLVQFGDGYEQRSADGINTSPQEWSNTFTRSPAVIDTIDTFLATRDGLEAFNWTTPAGESITVKCEEWDVSYDSPGNAVLTATFVQVFETAVA